MSCGVSANDPSRPNLENHDLLVMAPLSAVFAISFEDFNVVKVIRVTKSSMTSVLVAAQYVP